MSEFEDREWAAHDVALWLSGYLTAMSIDELSSGVHPFLEAVHCGQISFHSPSEYESQVSKDIFVLIQHLDILGFQAGHGYPPPITSSAKAEVELLRDTGMKLLNLERIDPRFHLVTYKSVGKRGEPS